MKNSLIILVLAIGLYSCTQHHKSTTDNDSNDRTITDTLLNNEGRIKTHGFSHDSYIHTEGNYTDSAGKGVIIQNSFPRGGGLIFTSNEKHYGHAVFWTRVTNKKDTALELTIDFPSDSIVIFPSSNDHFKLLVPPNTMTPDKVSTFSFGLEGIEAFVDENFHQPTQFRRTINPNEDCMFYVILLSHLSQSGQGVSRTGLVLKEQDLFYQLNTNSSNHTLIPCGKISAKE